MNNQENWKSLERLEPLESEWTEELYKDASKEEELVNDKLNFFELPLERQLNNAEFVTPTYYVGGSYVEGEYLWVYSKVKEYDGVDKIRWGTSSNPKYLSSRQISGEAIAILKAIDEAIDKGYDAITIFYNNVCFGQWSDLEGNNPTSEIGKSYRYYIEKKLQSIRVYFKKSESKEQKKISKDLLSRAKREEYGS